MEREEKKRREKKRRAERRRRRAADPSRNLHIPKGAPVTVNDIRQHALEGHPVCKGTGMVGETTPCRCSTLRFMKAHPEVIIEKNGVAWWPSKEVPT